jgi:hypothetical protein
MSDAKTTNPVHPLLGSIEPHAGLLRVPAGGQSLYKVMSVENLLKSISGSYLHFNRVDSYRDFSAADTHDGEQLPADRPGNTSATFAKTPTFSVADYYDRSRSRTYACSFSQDISDLIWKRYGGVTARGKVCVVFVFEKLRATLNKTMQSGNSALEYNGLRCHQILDINYGLVEYVDWKTYQANLKRLPNPIQYTYLKDKTDFQDENELRISLSATGMGQFVLNDGSLMEFPPHLTVGFDFRAAIADGTIQEFMPGPNCDVGFLVAELEKLHIAPKNGAKP